MPHRRDELIPTRARLLGRLKNWQDQSSWQEFFEDLVNPLAAFTQDGSIVVLGGEEGAIYRPSHSGPGSFSRFAWTGQPLRELTGTNRQGEFAVLTNDGMVRVIEWIRQE